MVKATPVLSLVISLLTSEEGVLVGKGPSVSVGLTVHDPEEVPDPVPELVSEPLVLLPVVSLPQARGATAIMPNAANPFLKKFFLSMVV
jgi:hypothetical protein